MSDVFKTVVFAIGVLIVFVFVCWCLGWIGLAADRPIQRYQEETRAQTYDNSRQYEQGTNRDIARYCEQMRTAPNDSARRAIAGLIRSDLSTFNGTLTPDNQTCANEAGVR